MGNNFFLWSQHFLLEGSSSRLSLLGSKTRYGFRLCLQLLPAQVRDGSVGLGRQPNEDSLALTWLPSKSFSLWGLRHSRLHAVLVTHPSHHTPTIRKSSILLYRRRDSQASSIDFALLTSLIAHNITRLFCSYRCGDRLLAVDGHSLENIPHALAVSMLKQTSTRVVLEVVSWMGTEL